MRPIAVTVGPLASAVANNIATTQTPVSGTALTLNGSLVTGGVAVLDKPRSILLTFGNEASNRTLVLSGTNWQGDKISETLAVASGAGGTVPSVLSYATLTSALPAGGGWTAAVTLGTNGVADSPWVRFNEWAPAGGITVQSNVVGTVNYTLFLSNDDPNSPTNPVLPSAMSWQSSQSPIVASTASAQGIISAPFLWAKVTLNSETAATSSVTTRFVQLSS